MNMEKCGFCLILERPRFCLKHVLAENNSSRKTDRESYPKINDKNLNIDVIKEKLNAINEHRQSVTKKAENLKKLVRQHREEMKIQFNKYVDWCYDEVDKEINEKWLKVEKQINLHLKNILKLITELEERNKDQEIILQNFDPVTVSEDGDKEKIKLKMFIDDNNLSLKIQNLILNCFNEKMNLVIKPNLLHEQFLSTQLSKGNLKPADEFKTELLLKTFELFECPTKTNEIQTELLLKTFELFECLSKTNELFCGACLKEEATELCSNCRLHLCLSCKPFHQKCFKQPEEANESLKKNEFLESLTKGKNIICEVCSKNKVKNVWFNKPKRDLESLKEIQAKQIFCGTCSEEEVTKFCLDCKLYLCLSCTSVHQKIPKTKNDILAKINSSKKEDIEASYCKSCQKWISCKRCSDHNCILKTFVQFKKDYFENVQHEIAKKEVNIYELKSILLWINVLKVELTIATKNLKKQIQKHCEEINNSFIKYINSCHNDINAKIDRKSIEVKKQLDLNFKKLLVITTELEERNNIFKKRLQEFDPATFVAAIEKDDLKASDDDGIILTESEKLDLFFQCSKEKLDLFFQPNLLDERFFSSQISIGNLKSSQEVQLKLIKVIKVKPEGYNHFLKLSITKTKLYLIFYSCGIYKSAIYCNKTYEYLSTIELQNETISFYDFELIGNFFCVLNDSSLDIYDLEKHKDSPDWKKIIKLNFIGKKLIHSSGTNLYILETNRLFEITFDGEVVGVVMLPDCIANKLQANLDSFNVVRLKSHLYVISTCDDIYLFNCEGFVIKKTKLVRSGSKFNKMIKVHDMFLFVTVLNENKIIVYDLDLNPLKVLELTPQIQPVCLFFDSTTNHLLISYRNHYIFSVSDFLNVYEL